MFGFRWNTTYVVFKSIGVKSLLTRWVTAAGVAILPGWKRRNAENDARYEKTLHAILSECLERANSVQPRMWRCDGDRAMLVGFCCVSASACSRFVAVWQTQDVWEVAWTPRDFTELMNAGPTQQLQRVSALQELQTGLEASLALLLCYGHEHRHHWLYWDDLIKCKVYALCLWGFRAKSQICFLWSAFVYFKLIIQNCLRQITMIFVNSSKLRTSYFCPN